MGALSAAAGRAANWLKSLKDATALQDAARLGGALARSVLDMG
jgi:hypothetical protein